MRVANERKRECVQQENDDDVDREKDKERKRRKKNKILSFLVDDK